MYKIASSQYLFKHDEAIFHLNNTLPVLKGWSNIQNFKQFLVQGQKFNINS